MSNGPSADDGRSTIKEIVGGDFGLWRGIN